MKTDTDGHRSDAPTLRIALLGGDLVSLHALRFLLENRMEAKVREYLTTSEYVTRQTSSMSGHILIVDMDTLDVDMATLMDELGAFVPARGIIILSTHREVAVHTRQVGNAQFVLKADSPQRLLSAVERLRIRGMDA